MDEDKTTQLPEKDRGYSILERREVLRRQLKCPACGCGRMPDSRYCLSCGSELPEIERAESPETIEQKRWQSRALNSFVDLVPGVASPKVIVCSLLALGAGCGGAPLAFYVFSALMRRVSGAGAGGIGPAMFGLCLYALIGFFSLVVYVLGLIWLLRGEMCSPMEVFDAFGDFRPKHWVMLIALTILGARIVFWIL